MRSAPRLSPAKGFALGSSFTPLRSAHGIHEHEWRARTGKGSERKVHSYRNMIGFSGPRFPETLLKLFDEFFDFMVCEVEWVSVRASGNDADGTSVIPSVESVLRF